jgi:hypothetical protein
MRIPTSLALFTSALALTLSGAALAKEKVKKDPNDPNRRICKVSQKTGTRFDNGRTCKTAAQWQADAKKNGVASGQSGRSDDGGEGLRNLPQ